MIGVLIERDGGGIGNSSLEVLTLARAAGAPVALWLGDRPTGGDLARLAEYGVGEVRVCAIGEKAHLPSEAAAALEAAAEGIDVVLGVSTFATKEAATRFASATGAGVVVDASGVEVVDGAVETSQHVFTATYVVRSRITAERAVVLLRPNSTVAEPAAERGEARVVDVPAPARAAGEVLLERTVVPAEGVPLAGARVVVSGGRGTGGDFALVRELAEVLGGAVGATRDATDEGWIGHEHMVGQTGVTVTPALYVACGISGAVHHRGGMQGSSTIVAIDTDPDAPIFEIADFAVIGDLFEVLPTAIAAIRARG